MLVHCSWSGAGLQSSNHFALMPFVTCALFEYAGRRWYAETWLILPVVICLSQRLSHACLSISFYTAKLRMAH